MSDKSQADFYHRQDCRICHSRNLKLYLDLGEHPPSNSFIRQDQVAGEQRFPLRVYLCQDCGLSQLRDVVSASHIFDEYMYLSSTSGALRRHYQGMVDSILSQFQPRDGALAVDIGCNDGITLKAYPKDKYRLLGVEPSSAGKYAREAGFEVVTKFFERNTAAELAAKHGHADVITSTNVYAHVDDIISFTEGVRALLDPERGVWVIEFPYVVDLLEKKLFDTVYHEHLCYLGLTPLCRLYSATGLRAFKVERMDVGASGPALRLYVCREEARHELDPSITKMLADEEKWGIRDPQRYTRFAEEVAGLKTQLRALLAELRSKGQKVGAFGAPAKGNTLLNYLEVTPAEITAVAENNDLKVGKLTPGTHIPIVSDEKFLELGISTALLLTWNYAEFFLKNSEFVRRGGKFIIPLPEPVIRP